MVGCQGYVSVAGSDRFYRGVHVFTTVQCRSRILGSFAVFIHRPRGARAWQADTFASHRTVIEKPLGGFRRVISTIQISAPAAFVRPTKARHIVTHLNIMAYCTDHRAGEAEFAANHSRWPAARGMRSCPRCANRTGHLAQAVSASIAAKALGEAPRMIGCRGMGA